MEFKIGDRVVLENHTEVRGTVFALDPGTIVSVNVRWEDNIIFDTRFRTTKWHTPHEIMLDPQIIREEKLNILGI